MRKIPRGWSNQKVKSNCEVCKKQTTQEIIQYQNKISIGPIPIMGKGPRGFGKLCSCGNIQQLNKKDLVNATKIKYYDKPVKIDKSDKSLSLKQSSKRIKYPVLKEKERQKYIKHNKKEGFMSMGLGLVIGLFLFSISLFLKWSVLWSVGLTAFFLISGIYAAYEDPERKYRDYYKAGKKI